MKLLFDTHALLWWLLEDDQLPKTALQKIDAPDAQRHFSAVSVYEIALKTWLGKLSMPTEIARDLGGHLTSLGLNELPLSAEHAFRAGTLDLAHRDPFDRMLVAQALVENVALVSNERIFDTTGVRRIWK